MTITAVEDMERTIRPAMTTEVVETAPMIPPVTIVEVAATAWTIHLVMTEAATMTAGTTADAAADGDAAARL